MKILLSAAVAASLTLSVAAAGKSPLIVVKPGPLQDWITSTSRQLDRALERVDSARAEPGISFIRFTADPQGRPANVMPHRRGYNPLDQVALRAVQRLRLAPVPGGVSRNQVYQAVIVVGDTPAQVAQLRSSAAARLAEENARFAARGLPNPVISLGAVSGF
jgi:hypothetical protein